MSRHLACSLESRSDCTRNQKTRMPDLRRRYKSRLECGPGKSSAPHRIRTLSSSGLIRNRGSLYDVEPVISNMILAIIKNEKAQKPHFGKKKSRKNIDSRFVMKFQLLGSETILGNSSNSEYSCKNLESFVRGMEKTSSGTS